jgi:hypothetical protein
MRIALLIVMLAGCQAPETQPQLRQPTYREWLEASDTAREMAAEIESNP